MRENPRKKQIVEAAARAMASRGYSDASIKEIAAEAGLAAPGLVHYYFKTKEEILHEVVRESCRRYEAEFGGLSAERDAGPDAGPDAAAQPLPETGEDADTHRPEWYKLRYELFALGLRSPELAGEIAELLRVGQGGISGVLQAALPVIEAEEREALSAVLLACFDGLALQKMLRPELDLEKAYALLESMIVERFPPAE